MTCLTPAPHHIMASMTPKVTHFGVDFSPLPTLMIDVVRDDGSLSNHPLLLPIYGSDIFDLTHALVTKNPPIIIIEYSHSIKLYTIGVWSYDFNIKRSFLHPFGEVNSIDFKNMLDVIEDEGMTCVLMD